MARRKKKSSRFRKFAIAFLLVVLAFVLLIGYRFYHRIYAPNLSHDAGGEYLYVPTGCDYDQLLAILSDQKVVRNIEAFAWVAIQMNLPGHINPGRYRLEKNMNNYELVKRIRGGLQEPVRLVINKFRLKADLAGFVGRKLEADSLDLLRLLNDVSAMEQYDLKPENSLALIIPNTYEFYWNTSADQFLKRMKKEYDNFWTTGRLAKAQHWNITPVEVSALASIVEEETNYQPEKSTIAGVYLNRLKKGMPLQADPTVRYAIGDFTITRVLNVHLAYVSAYNTYLNAGLPPGPICTPSAKTMDAVLNAQEHDYLYFCADPDKPGTHAFAASYQQHLINAKRYQQWLNSQRN